jgi:hypothetical protein
MEHSDKVVYTEYVDPKRDEWTTKIQPALQQVPLKLLVRECVGLLSRRTLINSRAGRSRPHRKNQAKLADVLKRVDLQQLQ